MPFTDFDRQQREHWSQNTNRRPYEHPVVRAYAEQRIGIIRELLGVAKVGSALEVGCGDGFGMHYFPAIVEQIYGCDISHKMLLANPEKRFVCQADALALPYGARRFDLVYSWELLHHLHRPLAAVQEMARVSRKFVLLFEPNSFNLPMALFGLAMAVERGLLRFTPWYLRRLLLEAGVEPVRVFCGGTFTPNRTPSWLVPFLRRLPYRWPLVGMYNVALGRVDGS